MKTTSQFIILKLSEATEEENLENVQKMTTYNTVKDGRRFFSKEQDNPKASGGARHNSQTCSPSQNTIL